MANEHKSLLGARRKTRAAVVAGTAAAIAPQLRGSRALIAKLSEGLIDIRDNIAGIRRDTAAIAGALLDFDVDGPTEEISANGADVELEITGNVRWFISGLPEWITANVESGVGPETVTLTVAENILEESRTATVVVASTTEFEFVVTQAAAVTAFSFVFPEYSGTGGAAGKTFLTSEYALDLTYGATTNFITGVTPITPAEHVDYPTLVAMVLNSASGWSELADPLADVSLWPTAAETTVINRATYNGPVYVLATYWTSTSSGLSVVGNKFIQLGTWAADTGLVAP